MFSRGSAGAPELEAAMSDVTFTEELVVLAAALLCRALVRLELDELLGHVVVVTLGQDAQDSQSGFVHVDAFAQWQPTSCAALGGHVLQLQDGHAHSAVLSGEAVVLHTHLELVALRAHLVTQGAAEERSVTHVFWLQQQQTFNRIVTHKVNVSLYLGAQLLFLDLVAYFLFLSLRWGPMIKTSTKGRNIP